MQSSYTYFDFAAKMTRSRALVVMTLITLWQVSRSVVLTPSSISACPGDEIDVKCTESDTTTTLELRWTITLENTTFEMVDLHLSNNTRTEDQKYVASAGVYFYSELISSSPLTATLTTSAHPVVDGAMVRCRSSASMGSLTIRVLETEEPKIRLLNVTGKWFEEENLTVIIKWEGNSDCLNFTVSLTSSSINSLSSDYSITTKNNSHGFNNILYNINYTVTVIASRGDSSSDINKTFNFIKCESPSHQEHVIVNGYNSPALENVRISFSCPPGYGFPDSEHANNITSTCTNEALWSPDLSLFECQRNSVCGQLSSVKSAYRILNHTVYNRLLVEFQCVHTPYITDPFFTTECLAGQWNPHPRDVCGQDSIMSMGKTIVIILGAVMALVFLTLVGTICVMFTIAAIKFKKGRNYNNIMKTDNRRRDQTIDVIPGSGILTPNASYEPIKISQTEQREDFEVERNPAYATLTPDGHSVSN